jgi:type II secretory pathway component PulF
MLADLIEKGVPITEALEIVKAMPADSK